MSTREENKRKLIQAVAKRESLMRVLFVLDWFGWATIRQAAGYLHLSTRRVNCILDELFESRMVKYKRTHALFGKGRRYWYLLRKGISVLRVRDPHVFSSPIRRGQIPDTPFSHHHGVVDAIIELREKGFKCTSCRHSLWPSLMQQYGKQYHNIPDFWVKKEKETFIAAEVERTVRGKRYYAPKMNNQQKRYFERFIPTLYIPMTKKVEKNLHKIIKQIKQTGEYTMKKGKPDHLKTMAEFDYRYRSGEKVGAVDGGIGFMFSNTEMTKFTAPIASTGEWIESPFTELADKAKKISETLFKREEGEVLKRF